MACIEAACIESAADIHIHAINSNFYVNNKKSCYEMCHYAFIFRNPISDCSLDMGRLSLQLLSFSLSYIHGIFLISNAYMYSKRISYMNPQETTNPLIQIRLQYFHKTGKLYSLMGIPDFMLQLLTVHEL